VLPTHSDGFALTQLEAQARGLPVIASRYCGQVVKDGVNGPLLPEVTAKALAQALRDLVTNPRLLESMASESRVREEFSLESVGELLEQSRGQGTGDGGQDTEFRGQTSNNKH
jgi:glycosyltransferase involved in cell wall biosynthesis